MASEVTALSKAYDLTVWTAERVARFPRTQDCPAHGDDISLWSSGDPGAEQPSITRGCRIPRGPFSRHRGG